MKEFTPFPKVPRLLREMVITEKIDGTNASVTIVRRDELDTAHLEQATDLVGEYVIYAGSRRRFIQPEGVGPGGCDNFGFAAWVQDNAEELVKLGEGTHFGEWWGKGIQRGYGLDERRFSLFNVGRWANRPRDGHVPNDVEYAPVCCHVVPVLYTGLFNTTECEFVIGRLYDEGSHAAPGFMGPEGIIVYHTAAKQTFKTTFEHDGTGKENK